MRRAIPSRGRASDSRNRYGLAVATTPECEGELVGSVPVWRGRTALVLYGATIATVIAFRDVLLAPFGLVDPTRFQYWFFLPERDSGALAVVIALWLFWNRRHALAAARRQRVDARTWGVAALVLGLYVWATWMRIQVQLIPILCITIATLAAAWGGWRAVRSVAMPCVALLLAFPPPAPLQAEILWRLQGATVVGANALLTLAGFPTQLEGTEIRMGGHAFVIIEACSGWRGIQVLSLVGLVAAELWRLSPLRTLVTVLLAIPLGIGLNILRACLVMLTQEELRAEFFESHTPQGLAVLLLGSIALYAVAAVLARARRPPDAEAESVAEPSPPAGERRFASWAALSLALPIALAGLSWVMPRTLDPIPKRPRYEFHFPTELPPWHGTPVDRDYFFPYSLASNAQFHVDYRGPTPAGGVAAVDLFVARELPSPSGLDRMPDSKLLLPANDWTLVSAHPIRLPKLGIDAREAVVTRTGGSQKAYVVAWRLHDRGLMRETFYSLLVPQDCERSPDDCLRTVVRIVVPFKPDVADAEFDAKRTARRFIDDFILPLKSLELI
jgi:exosortase